MKTHIKSHFLWQHSNAHNFVAYWSQVQYALASQQFVVLSDSHHSPCNFILRHASCLKSFDNVLVCLTSQVLCAIALYSFSAIKLLHSFLCFPRLLNFTQKHFFIWHSNPLGWRTMLYRPYQSPPLKYILLLTRVISKALPKYFINSYL